MTLRNATRRSGFDNRYRGRENVAELRYTDYKSLEGEKMGSCNV